MTSSEPTRIKLCGFTRAADIALACDLGVDFLGLIFAAKSPRALTCVQAERLRQAVTAPTAVVALFMNNPHAEVAAVVAAVAPDVLQFHGDEDEDFCRSFGRPYIKTMAMGGAQSCDIQAAFVRYRHAWAFLLDGHPPGAAGGSGQGFDWSRLPRGAEKPLMVAGGLTPENVYGLVHAHRPWGVDAASGVESAPGIKDGDKMRDFVAAVRRADHEHATG
ncbi:N-(5'-phosphoribosyl)anthranilate isomerase [Lysobacteraceae bacterium NML120232]|nr:N-(5'-phosphoribosyl)anthranilate isomerase [Xanthomonadaceae bacterium NML08-0793]PJK13397.1 N-(5'-phosphoribosyl)anthranilate isomerase [Xanthomonadaceae bacterium NML120232]